jgi:hypothetical protein
VSRAGTRRNSHTAERRADKGRRRKVTLRFAERFNQMIRERFGDVADRLESALALGHGSVVRWKSGRGLPSGQELHWISSETGYSADWLLGLSDVKHRASVGHEAALSDAAFADQLRKRILVGLPADRERYVPAGDQLLSRLVEETQMRANEAAEREQRKRDSLMRRLGRDAALFRAAYRAAKGESGQS